MNNKVIAATFLIMLLLVGVVIITEKASVDSLFRVNVKALADGTPVQTCLLVGQSSNYQWGNFCNGETSTEMIYACEIMSYNRASGVSLCTK